MTAKRPKTNLHARETFRLYLGATWQHKTDSLLCLALPVSNLFLGVFMPLFASKVLAGIVTHGTHQWRDFAWFAGFAVIGLAANMVGIRRSLQLQAKVMEELHNTMFSTLMQRSVAFYNNQIGGKLVSDALEFVGAYGQLFNSLFIVSFGFALTIVIGLAIVIISSWQIGLVLGVLLACLTYWTIQSTANRAQLRSARLDTSKQLIAHVADNIVNAVTVKTFARETAEITDNRQLSHKLAQARESDWTQVVTNENQRMGVLLLMQITLVGLLIILTAHHPHLLATGIFAFTYTLTLINRFFTINTLTRQIEEAFLQASPMTKLLQQPIEITDLPDAKSLVVQKGAIVCTDVSFRYADSASSDYIFQDLNLAIQPGEKIGLVGHSGGGKSTLTRLLLRFDDISGGSIAVDGQDIKTVTQASLREQISYVPQEPLLFHRSIRDNIAYGNPRATQKEIEQAARLAYAHDFIAKLPEGYKTIVGERGVKLSGGQRQRVAIARAMLKNAPILVLDEATSALDSESEKAIQKALWELMDGKTAVVIAHRLSTIQKMDRILVLDNGKIVEDGSHKQLLAAKGIYAKLWAHQSGGFIEE
jgi:ATP-binding cassette subfamily B protein